MMRRTQKYKAALQCARENNISTRRGIENADLYEMLTGNGWWWDRSSRVWKDTPQPSQSVFTKTVQGEEPTGVVKIRVMAHPDEVDEFVRRIQQAPGIRIFETSDCYQNRKGIGVRVYLTGLADDTFNQERKS